MAPNQQVVAAEQTAVCPVRSHYIPITEDLPSPKAVDAAQLSAKDPSNAALQAACGLTPQEVLAMQTVWAKVTCADQPKEESAKVVSGLGIALFELLFERHPQLLDLFPAFKGSDNKPVSARMEGHAVKVLTTLGAVLTLLDDFPTLSQTALGLIQRHVKYGVILEHYDMVLGVVAEFLHAGLSANGLWDDVQASAWPKLVALIKAVATSVYATA